MHGDGSDSGERRQLRGHSIRDRDTEVGGDPVDLRVERELIAGARHELTDLELISAGTDVGDDAAQRIAQRCEGVEAVHHFLVCGHRALLGHGVDYLSNLLGSGTRLTCQRELGLLHLHDLGPCRDQGVDRSDQDATRLARRGRYVDHAEISGAVILRYLFHDVLSGVVRFVWREDEYQTSRASIRDTLCVCIPQPQLQGKHLPDLLRAVVPSSALLLDEAFHRCLSEKACLDELT